MMKRHRNQRSRILRLLRLREAKWRKRILILEPAPLPDSYTPVRRIRHEAASRAGRRAPAQRR